VGRLNSFPKAVVIGSPKPPLRSAVPRWQRFSIAAVFAGLNAKPALSQR